MKGERKGGEGKRKEGKGQGLALQTASLDPPLMDVQNEFTHKYTKTWKIIMIVIIIAIIIIRV